MSRFKVLRCALSIGLALDLLGATTAPLPPSVDAMLKRINAADLKGNLSFLASDTLQGRYTPSPGLEVAAEFIASKFRAAGLEPGGDNDYFQMAAMVDRKMPEAKADLAISGTGGFAVSAQAITIADANAAKRVENAPLLFLAEKNADSLKGLDLKGKAIVLPQQDFAKFEGKERIAAYRRMLAFDKAVMASEAALEIVVVPHKPHDQGQRLLFAENVKPAGVPTIQVESPELTKLLGQKTAAHDLAVTFDVPAPEDTKVLVKNVIGILRGSDPALKSTSVLLTAHYDHIGTTDTAGQMAMSRPTDNSDHVYNGANDDGSGTVSVIEIAQALAAMPVHPKRSIAFVTFFGEERGELGSQFYGKHPVFPVKDTVADVNLEQVGRTDSTLGKELNNASVTGFDYSDVTRFLERAGRQTGIKVYKEEGASDEYFTRSDNEALAQRGVPAHTLCVAFDYPDYHGLGDEWPKVDYDNMARVDRMVALGVLNIANSATAPEWNAKNPKTEPFRQAQQKSRMAGTSGSGEAY